MEEVNQLANYITRTRRRDVQDDVQEFRVVRDPKAPVLKMTQEEREFYDAISETVKDYALKQDVNEPFLLSTPQRLLTSSMAAASGYWSKLSGSPDGEEVEESDDDLRDRSLNGRPLVAHIASRARDLDMTARLREVDTKYRLLIRELEQLWRTESKAKVIVFSSFKPTLGYLNDRLRDEGVTTELLHGCVSRPRSEILARFENDDRIHVLLSSEIGSEGVDLQFSSVVVNYDLPWNPMRLEQRIGPRRPTGSEEGEGVDPQPDPRRHHRQAYLRSTLSSSGDCATSVGRDGGDSWWADPKNDGETTGPEIG